ncbi:SAM-dependent methyltransferase [Nonomuraea dietziae]|uniref:SAM-dependent methyltransferase n=1 Tax=Nonomuraea dietziae TaxID=65515 RepID=A0A7W5YT08_9ACTN|nr:class I SAM-dependent methyltransferase [Nonomuraea dietziae]MBB3729744.1 SAM-dependent methyltransferase [Nonomuraea dietziae]
MDRQLISHFAHADHQIAAPVSEAHLDRLLRRARLPEGARVLDLGCGEGFWLVRLLEMYGDATGDGVDISQTALDAARAAATAKGVADRLGLHLVSATGFSPAEPYDLVLCVGSTHAFDGLTPTLEQIRKFLKPGGLALVGEGFYEKEPSEELRAEIGDYEDLARTVARAEASGFRTVYAHTSELGEWDEYEWSWTGSLLRWALANPGPDGEQARAAALEHREMWLNGYRGVLGFVTLLLAADLVE